MSDLAALEQTRLATEEAVIERGLHTFVEVGKALAVIRDQRLYRAEHDTFEAYCKQRWSLSRNRAYDLIVSAQTVEALPAMAGTPAPASERQARALRGLDPESAAEVMTKAHQATSGKPTAAAIRQARPDTGEIAGPAYDPIGDAVAEAKSYPSSHGARAVELLEKAHREIVRAGGPEAIIADLTASPLGTWQNELAADAFDRLIPMLTAWQTAIRRTNLRSVK